MLPLDSRTIAVYNAIEAYWKGHNFAPTVREIGTACFLSPAAILPHLDKLERIGCITRESGVARTLRIINPLPQTTTLTEALYQFIVERIHAGQCPSQDEMSLALYTSTQNVRKHLRQLEDEGLIQRTRHHARSIVLLNQDDEEDTDSL